MAEQESRFLSLALEESKELEVEQMLKSPPVALEKERAEVGLGGRKYLTLQLFLQDPNRTRDASQPL